MTFLFFIGAIFGRSTRSLRPTYALKAARVRLTEVGMTRFIRHREPGVFKFGHHGISGDFGQFFSTAILRYNQWLAYVTD
jgi:hypothetical protein